MFNIDWSSPVLQAVVAFAAGALFQGILAFMLDDIRERRTEARLARREETAARKARWTKSISDTDAYCHAMVAWLQRRATLQRDEMSYYLKQLDGTVYPDRDISLLGTAGLEYFKACNELFGMRLEPGRDDSIAIARVAGHAMVTVNNALATQQARVDAGHEPAPQPDGVREQVEAELAAFLQRQQGRVDELMRLLALSEKGVDFPPSAVPR